MKKIKKAFSLIEILVGIFIFLMWLVSIYAIITSTLKLNSYNRDYIVASNLSREQIELVRNIRDTNFAKIQNYKILNPNLAYSTSNIFKTGSYYKIENDFSPSASFPVKVEESANFIEDKNRLWENTSYRLCLNSDSLYVYCNWDSSLKKTPFYKYIKIEEVLGYPNSFKVISKISWNNRWYHEFDIKAIFTDYKIF